MVLFTDSGYLNLMQGKPFSSLGLLFSRCDDEDVSDRMFSKGQFYVFFTIREVTASIKTLLVRALRRQPYTKKRFYLLVYIESAITGTICTKPITSFAIALS